MKTERDFWNYYIVDLYAKSLRVKRAKMPFGDHIPHIVHTSAATELEGVDWAVGSTWLIVLQRTVFASFNRLI